MSAFTGSISADFLVQRKRWSTWILLGILVALAAAFAYVVPYVTYRNNPDQGSQELVRLLPENFIGNVLVGFPFFGGTIALILGVLSMGSEYGWNTLKTLFTQRPSRLSIFGAKIVTIFAILISYVLLTFAMGVIASLIIAGLENAPTDFPSTWLILRGLMASWFILCVWATLGIMLAILSRGTALAIGVGILYGLVIEGLISAFASQVDALSRLTEFFLRANGYSLIKPLGVSLADVGDSGPGSFSGPYVGGVQAIATLTVYLAIFVLVSALVLHKRDVT